MDAAPNPSPPRTRVLVVDDNPDGLFITGKLIETAGFEVMTSPDGADALRAVAESRPDLVLSDVVMPGLDGRELCRRIKADPANANVQVALISGIETLPQNVADGLDCGADDYLTRPIATAELLARLRSLERLHHALSALAETARQRERASIQLEHRVVERTAELAQATQRLEAEVVERRRYSDTLAAFASLANRLNSATTTREAATIIVETARNLLGWDSCSLVLCPPGTGRSEPVLNMDMVGGRCQAVESAITDGSPTPMTRRIMRHGAELILRDGSTGKVPKLTAFGDVGRRSESMLFAPIFHAQRAIGVLSIQSYWPCAYTSDSLKTLQALAEHCGGALERIHTQEALRRQAVRLRLVNNLSRSLLAPLSLREMASTACHCLEREFGYYNVAVLVCEAGTDQLTLEANAGAYSAFLKPGQYRQLIGKGVMGRVAKTGRRCIVQDVSKSPDFFELEGMAIRSEVAVPIRVRGRMAGVLNVDSDRSHGFETADVELFETVAGLLAAGFERARLFADVEAELAERRRAVGQVRDAQRELTQVLGSISDYVWSVEVDARGRDVRRFYSPVVEAITGRPASYFTPDWRRWLDTVHPDDRTRVAEVARAIRAGRVRRREDEYRIVRPDGAVRWIRNSIVVRRLPGGSLHVDGIASDITARKQAEATLRELPARTLAAQEAERRRIAGELHDSVSQILSSAKFRLHAGEAALPAPVARRNRQFKRGRALVEVALKEIRRITRNLRPSELDDLGLIPALRMLLDEFKDRTGLRVTFTAPRAKAAVPPAVALAAYRIVQEGLANIERHARASTVRVRLAATARALRLTLTDDGRGFNPRRPRDRAQAGAGIGLVHMRERAAALGGGVTIETSHREGTRITADLPFVASQAGVADNSRRAAILGP